MSEKTKIKALPAPPKDAEILLVKMVNPSAEGNAPATADVHPDEVKNFAMGGWQVKEK